MTEGLILARAGEAQARQLLSAGAPRVFLGEAALRDATLVERLAAAFGGERIGVYVPARRMPVNWSMDTVSNADFRVLTPSVCEPCWEILTAEGLPTDTHAAWWIGEMFERGASRALIRVDPADDADLNILAGLTEQWGERLWVAPRAAADPDLQAWVELAGVRRLAVPETVLGNSPYLMAHAFAPASGARESAPSPAWAGEGWGEGGKEA
ncbi:MAG: hypothetical protein HYZ19_00450 [Rhodocyclales bacterium]|nr:hypothetical protein [Rhodocyclales bacterium]